MGESENSYPHSAARKIETSNQIILVTGATGNQGGSVARHLLQRGIIPGLGIDARLKQARRSSKRVQN